MRKNVVLAFLFVLMFSCFFYLFPDIVLADNQGKVKRDKDSKHTFLSVQFTVVSNAPATGTIYRTTGLKIGIGKYEAFFDQAELTKKGFYSSSTSDVVDFTAGDVMVSASQSIEIWITIKQQMHVIN